MSKPSNLITPIENKLQKIKLKTVSNFAIQRNLEESNW